MCVSIFVYAVWQKQMYLLGLQKTAFKNMEIFKKNL